MNEDYIGNQCPKRTAALKKEEEAEEEKEKKKTRMTMTMKKKRKSILLWEVFLGGREEFAVFSGK
jgi:hypothetical protein